MEKIGLANDLLGWYFENERQLPWRQSHDPYRIWLSEIMLQQTQVVTVIDYFNRFIDAFPTIEHLATAEEADVFKLWEGLGYYSRARNLMRCAKVLIDEYDGVFPQDLSKVLKLPGIGPYTAGAILSIAYNMPVPAVDGNVMRVMSRLYASDLDIADPKTRAVIERYVLANLPEDRRHFNQALMELGALICTPKQPKCDRCPVSKHCLALANAQVSTLPVKSKKIKRTEHLVPAALIYCDDEVLLVKKTDSGLLSGLWAFPIVELSPDIPKSGSDAEELHALQEWAAENLELQLDAKTQLVAEAKHIFTHKTWYLRLWQFKISSKVYCDFPETVWTRLEHIDRLALSTAMKKLIKKAF